MLDRGNHGVLEGVAIAMSYLVIDNFCPDAERVRQSALTAGIDTWRPSKGQVGSSVYEGMGFWGDHALMVKSLMHAMGGPIVPNTLYFRVTNEETEQAYIHSDRETGSNTCVCYLTDHADLYGTAFYRHKATGLTEMPSMEEMHKSGIFEELRDDMVARDPAKWEELDFVQGRKNRALIFKAPMFHSRLPVGGFGNDAVSGRMVWVSHFYRLGPNGELV
jgi:hypothetical protein